MTRHPTWLEIKQCLEKGLMMAHVEMEDAELPQLYRLQAEAKVYRALLNELPGLPLILDNTDQG